MNDLENLRAMRYTGRLDLHGILRAEKSKCPITQEQVKTVWRDHRALTPESGNYLYQITSCEEEIRWDIISHVLSRFNVPIESIGYTISSLHGVLSVNSDIYPYMDELHYGRCTAKDYLENPGYRRLPRYKCVGHFGTLYNFTEDKSTLIVSTIRDSALNLSLRKFTGLRSRRFFNARTPEYDKYQSTIIPVGSPEVCSLTYEGSELLLTAHEHSTEYTLGKTNEDFKLTTEMTRYIGQHISVFTRKF